MVLAVVLSLAFAVPVFADPGGEPNENASDKAIGSQVWGQAQKGFNQIYGPGAMGEDMSENAQTGNTPGAAAEVHWYKGQPEPPGPLY